jgi:hypothetical protein
VLRLAFTAPASDYRSGLQAVAPGSPVTLTVREAELAERVVSAVAVADCLLSCSSPVRHCGIPAEDLCLLAMHGASWPARGSLPAAG